MLRNNYMTKVLDVTKDSSRSAKERQNEERFAQIFHRHQFIY